MAEVFGVNEVWVVVSMLVLCAVYFCVGFFIAKSIFSSHADRRRLSPIPPPPPPILKDLPVFEDPVIPRPPVPIKADQVIPRGDAPRGAVNGGASFESL